MPTLSELSVISGIPSYKLKFLEKYGLEFHEEIFEIDRNHQKALDELSKKRVSPYVISYALRCLLGDEPDGKARFRDIKSIAEIKDLPFEYGLETMWFHKIFQDLLPTAQHWIDRAAGDILDTPALERIGRWALTVLCNGPEEDVSYNYLAARLLFSVPYEEMPNYSRPIQRALNRVKHYGHLDGCHKVVTGSDGKNVTFFHRPKWDF